MPPVSTAAETADDLASESLPAILKYLHDDIPKRPAYWGWKLLGRRPWSESKKLIEAPFRYQKSAFPTGHGIGKTDSTAILIALWLLSHCPSFVIVHGASWPNISSRIWPTLRAKVEGITLTPLREFIGKRIPQSDRNSANWKLGDEWMAVGLSPNKPEVSQGWHSEGGTLVIVDESSELTHEIFGSLTSFVKSRLDAMVLFGNPIRSDGPFADIAKHKPGYESWHVHNISSEQSPNFKATLTAINEGRITHEQAMQGQEILVVPGLQTYSWCKEKEGAHGRDSAYFQSRVLGRVPNQSEDTYIPRDLIMDCGLRAGPTTPATGVTICHDPAWSEVGDESVSLVIDPIHSALLECEGRTGQDTDAAGEWLIELGKKFGVSEYRIDEIGYGKALVFWLQRRAAKLLGRQVRVIGINASKTAHEPDEYFRVRDEMWGRMKIGLADFAIPPEYLPKFEEVSELRYEVIGSRLKIEDKRRFKARGNKSPNYADAFGLYFAREVGDRVFSAAGSHLQCLQTPELKWLRKFDGDGNEQQTYNWSLKFREIPESIAPPRKGVLARSIWYSHRGKSAAIWLHVDGSGTWTVFRCYHSPEGETLRQFVNNVHARSYDMDAAHTYEWDLLSAPAGSERAGSFHVINAVQDEFERLGSEEDPIFLQASVVSGMSGMDVLDRMMLATLARFPEDKFWQDSELNPDDYMSDDMLVCYNYEVVEALIHARLRNNASWQTDREEDLSEEAVGGGGPFVRALRLLTVSGVGAGV